MNLIGQPLDRIDGLLKVTGEARYAAEFPEARLAHAVLVTSTIARGTIASIDASRAQALPGVLLVMTYQNAPRLPNGGKPALAPPAGRRLSLLQDNQVHYSNEPVAVVVADTLEHATDAARQLRIAYQSSAATVDFAQAKPNAHAPDKPQGRQTDTQRGSFEDGMRSGAVHVDAIYTTPIEHHNPMEPHATMARWDGPQLTLYDSTQGVSGAAQAVAKTFGMPPGDVRVISPFIGGGFGCKGSSWSHVSLCAMAAKQTGRPVRLVLERPQMFGPVGARPRTEQHFALAARHDGTLTAMRHDSISNTSMIEDWTETCCMVTRMLYAVPNQVTTHRIVPLNLGTPTFMRAPGETTGSFALESAMDELAAALKMDPLALRLKNYAEADPQENKPWSSKSLARVLSDRRGEIRLVAAHARAAFDAQRQHADRHGHGDRDLSGQPQRSRGHRADSAGRHRDGRLRHAGSRHRHLHRDDPGGRRRARLRAGKHPLRARRFVAAESAGVGRLAIGGERVAGRARGGEPGAQPADRAGARRPGLAGARHRARRHHRGKRLGDEPLATGASAIRRRRSSRARAASRSRRPRPSSPATRSRSTRFTRSARCSRKCMSMPTSARSAWRAWSACTTWGACSTRRPRAAS